MQDIYIPSHMHPLLLTKQIKAKSTHEQPVDPAWQHREARQAESLSHRLQDAQHLPMLKNSSLTCFDRSNREFYSRGQEFDC